MPLDIRLKSTFKIPFTQKDSNTSGPFKFYDVKFYPFSAVASSNNPIFAIVGVRHILICRPPAPDSSEDSIVVLKTLCDLESIPETGPDILNSCEWNFVDPSQPLLSLAGASGLVKVFNAISGDEFATLNGHGIGIINDLATHPVYPWILASASMDSSVRIWDLRRCSNPKLSPCIIVCGHGQGHREGILTISWHSRGRYLISGAHDNMICLWTVPDLSDTSSFWSEIANPKRSSESVRVIHYPHFISAALHSDYVDCVRFYGDLILSKAADHNKIVLWKITGFNSRMEPPTPEQAPKTKEYLDTRSGFIHRAGGSEQGGNGALYERLLEFSIPSSESFYMRFSLLQPSPSYPELHPILAFGNMKSEIFFWDLHALEAGKDDGFSGLDRKKYPLHNPHQPMESHLKILLSEFYKKNTPYFVARSAAWSPCGRWCVVVGEINPEEGRAEAVGAIFERQGNREIGR